MSLSLKRTLPEIESRWKRIGPNTRTEGMEVMRKNIVIVFALASIFIVLEKSSVKAFADEVPEQLIGSWSLVSRVTTTQDGKPLTDPPGSPQLQRAFSSMTGQVMLRPSFLAPEERSR